MREPEPVLTAHLFPELLTALLDLLSSLSPAEWSAPVPRKSWSVKDVVLHLLGGDVGLLSRERDSFPASNITARTHTALVAALKALNDTWIEAGRRLSPRFLSDLLRFTGDQVSRYVVSLDPDALGGAVSWAGPDPVPQWLGVGQEYTERWHHQQHIRAAAASPGFDGPRHLRPAIDIFMRALPHAYRETDAPDRTAVTITIMGDSGGSWVLLRESRAWRLRSGGTNNPNAAVSIPQDLAWKLFTKWIPKDDAIAGADIRGDSALALRVFDMKAVIA